VRGRRDEIKDNHDLLKIPCMTKGSKGLESLFDRRIRMFGGMSVR